MDYQITALEEKKMIGLCDRTSNFDPQMGAVIGRLWQKLFEEGVYPTIPNKSNDRTIGLYSDYESDAKGQYDITVGCEVSSTGQLPAGTVVKTIPQGNYAQFIIQSDQIEAVGKAWEEIWKMPLERTFTGDFEEYYSSEDGKTREVHLFIAVK